MHSTCRPFAATRTHTCTPEGASQVARRPAGARRQAPPGPLGVSCPARTTGPAKGPGSSLPATVCRVACGAQARPSVWAPAAWSRHRPAPRPHVLAALCAAHAARPSGLLADHCWPACGQRPSRTPLPRPLQHLPGHDSRVRALQLARARRAGPACAPTPTDALSLPPVLALARAVHAALLAATCTGRPSRPCSGGRSTEARPGRPAAVRWHAAASQRGAQLQSRSAWRGAWPPPRGGLHERADRPRLPPPRGQRGRRGPPAPAHRRAARRALARRLRGARRPTMRPAGGMVDAAVRHGSGRRRPP